jgi:hypothetical protein
VLPFCQNFSNLLPSRLCIKDVLIFTLSRLFCLWCRSNWIIKHNKLCKVCSAFLFHCYSAVGEHYMTRTNSDC